MALVLLFFKYFLVETRQISTQNWLKWQQLFSVAPPFRQFAENAFLKFSVVVLTVTHFALFLHIFALTDFCSLATERTLFLVFLFDGDSCEDFLQSAYRKTTKSTIDYYTLMPAISSNKTMTIVYSTSFLHTLRRKIRFYVNYTYVQINIIHKKL